MTMLKRLQTLKKMGVALCDVFIRGGGTIPGVNSILECTDTEVVFGRSGDATARTYFVPVEHVLSVATRTPYTQLRKHPPRDAVQRT